MLLYNMGCPTTFEDRREELRQLKAQTFGTKMYLFLSGSSVEDLVISDAEVLESFRESLKEGGFMTQYVRRGQLGLILHDTLFIHGAVHLQSLG